MFRINWKDFALLLLASEVTKDPEQTELSLFANAIDKPFFKAETTEAKPADPVIAAITRSVLKSSISS